MTDPIIHPDDYALGDGRTLHVWLGGPAQEPELWACSVYDHGPFCRLCQRVDGVLNALLLNVVNGRMECHQTPDGEFRFRAAETGNAVDRRPMTLSREAR